MKIHNLPKMEHINVYIDGACINNGQPNAKAGYGVFFAPNDVRNEAGPVEGKQSNNTGELTAFIRCLEILQNDISKGTKIDIYCDSEYVIKCATTYGKKLDAANWKTSKDKEPPNLHLVKKAYDLYKTTKTVHLHYIRAHTGDSDVHSVGNSEVDKMANMAAHIAAGRTEEDIANLGTIIRLNIPFHNKDKAKELGARWDNNHKYWYVNTKYVESEIIEQMRTLEGEEQVQQSDIKKKIYVKIPYDKKDKAKQLGARWDASMKSWYYFDENISKENKKVLHSL